MKDFESLENNTPMILSGKRSPPNSMAEAEGISDSVHAGKMEHTNKIIKENNNHQTNIHKSTTKLDLSATRTFKSTSSYDSNNNDKSRRWSGLPQDSDTIEVLERTRYLPTDDDSSSNPTNSSRKHNNEVKNVADAGKRIKSRHALEPKNYINTANTTSSHVCPSYPRRICLPSNNCSSETKSLITNSSFVGRFSESYNPDKSQNENDDNRNNKDNDNTTSDTDLAQTIGDSIATLEKITGKKDSRTHHETLKEEKPTTKKKACTLPSHCSRKDISIPSYIKTEDNESSQKPVSRSPSIPFIQPNHVSDRIKEIYKNLEQSSTVSKSCPNLVICGSYSDASDNTDNARKPSSFGRISPTLRNSSNKNTDHIQKGTVRSLINRYGSVNHVSDT